MISAADIYKFICNLFQSKPLLSRIHLRHTVFNAKLLVNGKMLQFNIHSWHLVYGFKIMDVIFEEEDIAIAIL